MPTAPTDAWKALSSRRNVPSELRSTEWAMQPQWLRERSFWMAGVTEAEILQEFRNEAAAIVQGDSSVEQSRKRIEQFLDRTGYQAKPGQEGTIKDLRSANRILVTLRTNMAVLQGYGQKARGMMPGPLRAQPAWELVRVQDRTVPREWEKRWEQMGGELKNGRMIALKQDLIWAELGSKENFPDALGVDHPPFAYSSGMGWRAVGFSECKELGLLDGWVPPAPKPVPSPNEALEVTPKITEPALRDALSERLQGLAEWKKDKLVFTDPNGTRPATAEQLVELWKKPLPEVFRKLPGAGQMQREALLDWVADSSDFTDQGGKNRWDDFLRVLLRLKPSGIERGTLSRALTWNSNEKFSEFLEAVRRNGYRSLPGRPAESWTATEQALRKYLGDQSYRVVLRLPEGHSTGRSIAPIVRAFKDELLRREVPQGKLAITDDEVLLPSWAQLAVKSIGKVVETRHGKTVEIILQEVAR